MSDTARRVEAVLPVSYDPKQSGSHLTGFYCYIWMGWIII
jgi:hypothetical protein